MYSPDQDQSRRQSVFTAAAGIAAAVLGLTVIIGWHAHIPILVQLKSHFVPMQYNAALGLLFSGLGLCAFHWGWLRLSQALGGMAATLGGLTLGEYLGRFDAGVDQLFFHAYITTQTSHPGRMSPAAAICLLLIGLALFLMGLRPEWKWRAMALGSVGSVVVALCAAAIMGYAIDLPGAYGWGQLTRVALHTAVGLALLGGGIFVVAWNEGRKAGELTPRWLPVPLAFSVLTISLVSTLALESKQNQGAAQTIAANGEGVENIVNLCMEARVRSLERLVAHWKFSGHPMLDEWEKDAKSYANDFPDLQAMEWIDSAHLVHWDVPAPGGQQGEQGQNNTLEKRRQMAVELAWQLHEPVTTRTIELSQGGPAFMICVPVYTGKRFDGCIASAFDARTLFDRYLPPSVASGYAIAISEGDRTFYERYPGPQPPNKDWIFDSSTDQHGVIWNIRVWPAVALAAQMDSSIPKTLLCMGLVRAAVLGLIVYLAQKSSRQVREGAILNHELQTALAEVRHLTGMLPICAGCKRIRDDSGYWNEIERYVSRYSDASFSHGICPECAKAFYESEGLEVPADILKAVEQHDYD